jgi:hypothetical protein
MKKVSYLSVFLFIMTAWFTIFFFWTFIEFNNYIAGALRTGAFTFRGNAHEIVGYYMANCAPYLFYALVTSALGWLLLRLRPKLIVETVEKPVIPMVSVCDCAKEIAPD